MVQGNAHSDMAFLENRMYMFLRLVLFKTEKVYEMCLGSFWLALHTQISLLILNIQYVTLYSQQYTFSSKRYILQAKNGGIFMVSSLQHGNRQSENKLFFGQSCYILQHICHTLYFVLVRSILQLLLIFTQQMLFMKKHDIWLYANTFV